MTVRKMSKEGQDGGKDLSGRKERSNGPPPEQKLGSSNAEAYAAMNGRSSTSVKAWPAPFGIGATREWPATRGSLPRLKALDRFRRRRARSRVRFLMHRDSPSRTRYRCE